MTSSDLKGTVIGIAIVTGIIIGTVFVPVTGHAETKKHQPCEVKVHMPQVTTQEANKYATDKLAYELGTTPVWPHLPSTNR